VATTSARTVVLVEGTSDRLAVETLARCRGRDLRAEGIEVVPIGGAQAIGGFVERLGREGVRLAGLCDEGEERHFRRALERAGLGDDLTRADMESIGFYVCVADLEDELIRALGAEAVLCVVEEQGGLSAFRTMQKQPEWRGRRTDEQLRRWIPKIRYASPLVEALAREQVPRPLDRLLAHI
jgi:hypothetical protein